MELEDAKIAQAYLLSEALRVRAASRKNLGVTTSAPEGTYFPTATELPPIVTRQQSFITTGSVMVREKSQDSVNFLELPEGLLTELTPEVKVYKTYIIDDKEYDLQLPQGRVKAMVGGKEDTVELPVIKNVEFTRHGGNPAEIDTNIKFNIKLFARDISSYFTRTSITDTGVITDLYAIIDNLHEEAVDPSTPAATANENIENIEALKSQVAGFKDGVSWIDLIKIDPGLALTANTQLVTSEVECRIKVEVGYTMDPAAPIPTKYEERVAGDWVKWRAAIIAQREVFNLSLYKHQFEFRGKEGVGLSIEFIASGNAKQLSPLADLFSNPAMNASVEIKLDMIKAKRAEKKTAQEELADANSSADNRRSRILLLCVNTLKEDISELQEEIKVIKATIRVALLSQIYLDLSRGRTISSSERTRVKYRMYYHSTRDGAPRDFNVSYNSTPTGDILTSGASIASADLASALGEDSITGVDSDNKAVEVDLEDIGSRLVDGSKRYDAYVFLGDIIEAAFEVLVPGGLHTEIKRTQYNNKNWLWPGMTLVKVGGKYVFQSPFTHNAGQGGVAFNTEAPHKKRAEQLINEFGGYFLGLVTYLDPLDTDKSITTKLSDLPISLDMFRGWWLNKYVSTAKRSLPIRDFLTALMGFVQEDVFRGIPYEEGSGEVPDDTPKFVINSIVPTQELWNATYPPDWFNVRFNYVRLDAHGSQSPLQKNTLTVIEQVDGTLLTPAGTSRIIFGEEERGILKNLTFEREDIPGHAEARMFSDRESMAGNIALREKYNTSMEMLGTTAVLPGSLVYLDPKPLDLGYADENESLAKSLGLGGLYRVVRLTSTLDFDGAGQSWKTKLKTKWESFGDGTQGNAVSQLAGDISDCVENATTAVSANQAAARARRTPSGPINCFAAGTKISMHDGTMKNIEDIVIGDTVLSWDEKTNEITRGNVSGLNQPLHDDMVNLTWGSITNKNTFDHPFYVKDKGWCSYAPDLTLKRYVAFETVEKLETGDICYYINGSELEEIKLSNIEEEMDMIQTYIFSVEVYNTFFANNILTHNK